MNMEAQKWSQIDSRNTVLVMKSVLRRTLLKYYFTQIDLSLFINVLSKHDSSAQASHATTFRTASKAISAIGVVELENVKAVAPTVTKLSCTEWVKGTTTATTISGQVGVGRQWEWNHIGTSEQWVTEFPSRARPPRPHKALRLSAAITICLNTGSNHIIL